MTAPPLSDQIEIIATEFDGAMKFLRIESDVDADRFIEDGLWNTIGGR